MKAEIGDNLQALLITIVIVFGLCYCHVGYLSAVSETKDPTKQQPIEAEKK